MARAPYITASAAGTRDTAHGQDMTATGCMMRACLALCVAAALVGAARAHCDGCLDGECYRKHRLPVAPLSMNYATDVYRKTNTLYIHYETFDTMGQCQLDTGVCNNMNNTLSVYRLAVDQRTGDTYGTSGSSLYKFDLVNNEKTLLVRYEAFYVTFKDKIYYTPGGRGLYTYEDGVSRVVAGSEGYELWYCVVDKNDDIYLRTYVGVRRLSKGVLDPAGQWDGHYVSVDRDGNAVLFHPASHAVYRIINGQATEVGAIQDSINHNFNWPLFDRDNNIIYRTSDMNHFHLKREKGVHCTVSILENKRVITETVADTRPRTI